MMINLMNWKTPNGKVNDIKRIIFYILEVNFIRSPFKKYKMKLIYVNQEIELQIGSIIDNKYKRRKV